MKKTDFIKLALTCSAACVPYIGFANCAAPSGAVYGEGTYKGFAPASTYNCSQGFNATCSNGSWVDDSGAVVNVAGYMDVTQDQCATAPGCYAPSGAYYADGTYKGFAPASTLNCSQGFNATCSSGSWYNDSGNAVSVSGYMDVTQDQCTGFLLKIK